MAAVGKLKELKESFKKVAGTDYDANKKPVGGSSAAAPVAAAASAASPHMDLWKQTVEQGDKVRKLKAEKASKDDVTAAVNELKVPSGPPDLPGSCSDSEQCSVQGKPQ
jgi:bifunctional glutamyl/prolyl-tRNA synthetase